MIKIVGFFIETVIVLMAVLLIVKLMIDTYIWIAKKVCSYIQDIIEDSIE